MVRCGWNGNMVGSLLFLFPTFNLNSHHCYLLTYHLLINHQILANLVNFFECWFPHSLNDCTRSAFLEQDLQEETLFFELRKEIKKSNIFGQQWVK